MIHTIRRITVGDFTLEHLWMLDDCGLKRTYFDLFHTPSRTHMPGHCPFRADNLHFDHPFEGDNITPFTDEEYQYTLNEMVVTFRKYAKVSTPINPIASTESRKKTNSV